MSTALWRCLLIASGVLAGTLLGLWLGGNFFVPRNAGLAGGAMVLGYGVIGAVVAMIVVTVLAIVLKGRRLRMVALWFAVPVLGVLLGLSARLVLGWLDDREPDEAFAPAGIFTVGMERLDRSDPYLFVKMHIDSRERVWVQTGPDPGNRRCTASMRAQHLIDIRTVLAAFLAQDEQALHVCRSGQGVAIKRLSWAVLDPGSRPTGAVLLLSGSLDANAQCLKENPHVARLLGAVEQASLRTDTAVDCD